MQPPADPNMVVVVVLLSFIGLISLTTVLASLMTNKQLLRSNERLIETNRVLALGYANPDAALRLTQQQTSQTNAKRDAVLNRIKLAQTLNAKTRAQRNVAAHNRPPQEVPSLKYHNPVDDDIIKPEEAKEEGKK